MGAISASADFMAGVLGGFEPQRQFHWTIVVPIAHVGAPFLPLAVESARLPKRSIEPITLEWMNEKRYVAGKQTWETIPLTVKDFVDKPIADLLVTWQNLAIDGVTGVGGYAKEYKLEVPLVTFDVKMIPRVWTLKGCWITDLDPGQLSMTTNDKVNIEATLRYDRAEPTGQLGAPILSAVAGAASQLF